jgi:hypothetical protein
MYVIAQPYLLCKRLAEELASFANKLQENQCPQSPKKYYHHEIIKNNNTPPDLRKNN